ncbi:MAG TPA: ATP-dependent DNA helicase RecG [Gammaproteobacteria bacterium]|nr:ATP-dependent DNA helicase RecG [Gammaproteobacteria bacterium]
MLRPQRHAAPRATLPLEERPIASLRGVGPQLAARLVRLGLVTVQDLLFHLPLRYEDRTRIVPLGALVPGLAAVVEGEVELAEVAFRGRRTLLVRIADGTGALLLRFFHFSQAQVEGFARGARVRAYGEVRRGTLGFEMIHPEYRLVRALEVADPEDRLTPVYPATEGIGQGRLRNLAAQALALAERAGALRELLPREVREALQLPDLPAALRYVHRPPADAPLELLAAGRHPAQRRLAFEELLAHHLSLRRLRQAVAEAPAAELAGDGRLVNAMLDALPFRLTAAQQRVVNEIFRDLRARRPMMRLLQGDVGSGKTVVAALAALRAVECGRQAAIMAPTELLAEQHLRNLRAWFEPLGVEVAWLGGKLSAKGRASALARVRSGNADVVVGTHALFQEGVTFRELALVIIDEQHRFGVHQRLALREKGAGNGFLPHQLIMTATPIPRTLAMTAYADLDTSVIDELPPGRRPVKTVVVPESRRAEVVERVSRACAEGRQAYWVCPLIEESELLEAQAAEETAAALRGALPGLRIGLVHGRLKPAEKEAVMASFKRGDIELLVATTVIEVGVDVPNASLMVIENAERLGLAQLHQLRGRVGRGAAESTCVLLYKPPLGAQARLRLAALRETNDGFEIARRDLELRGPGELLGTRQTGLVDMHIADLVRDADLLPAVQRAAEAILARHPECVAPLIRRWLGDAVRYARA